jgi:glucan phosphoethanolaminetransferase (alkaline phosphatase superfamily)
MAAFFETSPSEIIEFTRVIPIANYFTALELLALSASALFAWRGELDVSVSLSSFAKTALLTSLIVLFVASPFFGFYGALIGDYLNYRETRNDPIGASFAYAIERRMDAVDREVRVVVLGANARKDYLSAYGYAHNDTPFLNRVNWIFIDGFVAPSYSSSSSVPLLFGLNRGGKPDLANSVVSLANKAGFQTYWFSNRLARDSAARAKSSIFGFQSDRAEFIASEKLEERDDFDLFDYFDRALDEKLDKPKIIFLHTYGSSGAPRARLRGFPNRFNLPYGNDLNCYLALIEKLDSFVQTLVEKLGSRKISWALIYLADHGSLQAGAKTDIRFSPLGMAKQSYEVPFFALDYKDSERVTIKRQVSGLRFFDFFAAWIGFNVAASDPRYDLKDFPQTDTIVTPRGDYATLRDDPALY